MNLTCFPHLRWNFVYLRPQHLVKRAANNFTVHYFEETLLSGKLYGFFRRLLTERVSINIPNLKEGLLKVYYKQ